MRGHRGCCAVQSLCLRVHGVRVGAQTRASSRHRRTRAQDSPELPVRVSLELLGLRCAPLVLPDGLGVRACLEEIGRRVLGGLGVGISVLKLSVAM